MLTPIRSWEESLPNLADQSVALDCHPQRFGEREDHLGTAHAAVLPGVAPIGDDVLLGVVDDALLTDTFRNILQGCGH